jgi:hypothetical protein
MNKLDLARRFAREWHRSRGKAADAVDRLVYDILKDLKRAGETTATKQQRHSSNVPAPALKDRL